MNHIKTLLTTTLLLTSRIWGADQLATTAADDTAPQAVSTVAEPSTLNLETQPIDELVRLAGEGWRPAQEVVTKGYANGDYGFPQNPKKLLKFANLGWKEAQEYVALGYAEGTKPSNAESTSALTGVAIAASDE